MLKVINWIPAWLNSLLCLIVLPIGAAGMGRQSSHLYLGTKKALESATGTVAWGKWSQSTGTWLLVPGQSGLKVSGTPRCHNSTGTHAVSRKAPGSKCVQLLRGGPGVALGTWGEWPGTGVGHEHRGGPAGSMAWGRPCTGSCRREILQHGREQQMGAGGGRGGKDLGVPVLPEGQAQNPAAEHRATWPRELRACLTHVVPWDWGA